jgi:hypothetical protein
MIALPTDPTATATQPDQVGAASDVRRTIAARSFGQFDDTLVAAEIFAEDDILNRLQSILLRLE